MVAIESCPISRDGRISGSEGVSAREPHELDVETVIEARAAMPRRQVQDERPGTLAPVAAADGAAFGVLIDRHYTGVLRFLTRQTGDSELAADLTQACFLDAYRSRHQLADEGAFAAWLFGIARNQLRMEWRRRKLRRLVSLDWLTSHTADLIPALSRDDDSTALHERDRIQQTLDELSPSLREALLLHDLCGFRGGEVAEILGISADAARKRIVRAEAEFRARYSSAATPAIEAITDER